LTFQAIRLHISTDGITRTGRRQDMSEQEDEAGAASMPGPQSSQDLGYSPIPAEEPDQGSGAIQPGQEQAGQGGYTGATGYSGQSNPDVEGDDYPASSAPVMIAADLVGGPVLGWVAAEVVGEAAAATTLGEAVAETFGEGVAATLGEAAAIPLSEAAEEVTHLGVMAGTSAYDVHEVVEHAGEGASGPEQSATPGDSPTEVAPQGDESIQDGGMTGSTSDGAGYSVEGQTFSSTTGGLYTEQAGEVEEAHTMEQVEEMGDHRVGEQDDSAEVEAQSLGEQGVGMELPTADGETPGGVLDMITEGEG
jgi:hypothetical protein